MPLLIDCPACARAIRRDESACPFCGAEQRRVEGPGSLRFLGVVLGLMSASCSEKPDDTESTTVPTSTAQTTDGQTTQNTTAVTDQPTSTSTSTTTSTTSTTTSSSTTDGSASASDSMDSFNVTTAYAAALETESAGAPPVVTEGDSEATTGETQ